MERWVRWIWSRVGPDADVLGAVKLATFAFLTWTSVRLLADGSDGCGGTDSFGHRLVLVAALLGLVVLGAVLAWPRVRYRRLRMHADRLATALRLSQEYVGDRSLPRQHGWEWFDALDEHADVTGDERWRP